MPRNITSAIRDGDINGVLEASEARFAPMWKAIAKQSQSRARQRFSDEDDVCQETLIALANKLAKQEELEGKPIETTEDVRRWTNRVARNKAIDAARRAEKSRGPSSLLVPNETGSEECAMGQVADTADTPIEEVAASEAVQRILGLEAEVGAALNSWSVQIEGMICELQGLEQGIIRRSVRGHGIAKMSKELSAETTKHVTHHFVRKTVARFVESLRTDIINFRDLLMEIEAAHPGVAQRIEFPQNVARYLLEWTV